MLPSPEITLDRIARLAFSGGATEDMRALAKLLGHEDWQMRRAAAEAIIAQARSHADKLNLDELLDELIEAISGDSAQTGRRAASIAVLEGICSIALPRIEAEIKAARQPAVRIALAGIAGAAGSERAVKLLAPLVRDEDTNVAAAAIAALGRTNDAQATRILLKHLASTNEWLRFAAVGALGELGDARAIFKLEELLEDSLMQEAAAIALLEIASLECGAALARHLRAEDKSLRPAVLAALVSLACDERTALPRAISDAIHAHARQAFRLASDESTFVDLARMASSSDTEHARAGLVAVGWLGDVRAVPIIIDALTKPPLVGAARRSLADLSQTPQALNALLAAQPHAIAAQEIALAAGHARSFASLEATAHLAVEATDAETLEACLAALAQAREWARSLPSAQKFESTEAARVYDNVRRLLATARGTTLIELAMLLGALSHFVPTAIARAIDEELSKRDDAVLARMAFRQNFSPPLAIEEARRAQRHPDESVRLFAIEILSGQLASSENISLAAHLTDEAVSVRRAGVRALRRGVPASTREVSRALHASLADEDIWVKAEALLSLGALFGHDTEVRAQLREELAAAHPLCRVAAAQALTAPASLIYASAETFSSSNISTAHAPLSFHVDAADWRTLAQMARRDAQAEVRRAVVRCFAHCSQPRTMLSVARAALKDAAWPVRHAAIDVLDNCAEAGAERLLLDSAENSAETGAVRGAALRALATRGAAETLPLACYALTETNAPLAEDAFAALSILNRTHRAELREMRSSCTPRAASVIDFILAETSDTSVGDTVASETSGGVL